MRDALEIVFWTCALIVVAAMWLMVAAVNLLALALAIHNPTPGNITIAFLSFFLWPIARRVKRAFASKTDDTPQ